MVRLVGDGSSYQQMLSQAQTSTAAAASQVQQHTERVGGFGSSITAQLRASTQQIGQFAGSVREYGAAAAAGLASLGAIGYLKTAFGQYVEMERGQIKLTAAIEGGGRVAEPLIARYRELAAVISETSLVTRGEVMAMAKKAETMGFSGEAAEKLIRASVGLAAATDMSAEHAMTLTIALERGNVQMLRRVPQLRGIHDETQLVAEAQRLMAVGLKIAEAESNSLGGQLHHLHEATKRLTKQFGELVGEGVRPVISWYRSMVDSMTKLDKETKTYIVTVAALVAGLAALPGILLSVKFALGFLTGGSTLLLAGVIAVGIAIAKWVNSVGGFKAAWDAVQAKFAEFWEWAGSTVLDFRDTLLNAWDAIKAGASDAWGWVKAKIVDNWETIKTVSYVVAGVVGAFLLVKGAIAAVTVALVAVKFVVATISAGIALLSSPFLPLIALVAVVVAGVYAWIKAVGGFGEAWKIVKGVTLATWEGIKRVISAVVAWMTPYWNAAVAWLASAWDKVKTAAVATWDWIVVKVKGFLDWAKPVFAAWIGYLSGLWEVFKLAAEIAWTGIVETSKFTWNVIKTVAGSVWDFLVRMWQGVFGSASVNWKSIQETIVEVLIVAEYGLKNLGKVAETMWSGAKYQFVAYANDISHFFTTTIPNIITNLPALIAGTADLSTIFAERVLGDLEQRLKDEFEALADNLGRDFAVFRERRLREIAEFSFDFSFGDAATRARAAANQGRDDGNRYGPAFVGAAKSHMQNFNAVLSNSAEALRRTREYLEVGSIGGQHGDHGASAAAHAAVAADSAAGHAAVAAERVAEAGRSVAEVAARGLGLPALAEAQRRAAEGLPPLPIGPGALPPPPPAPPPPAAVPPAPGPVLGDASTTATFAQSLSVATSALAGLGSTITDVLSSVTIPRSLLGPATTGQEPQTLPVSPDITRRDNPLPPQVVLPTPNVTTPVQPFNLNPGIVPITRPRTRSLFDSPETPISSQEVPSEGLAELATRFREMLGGIARPETSTQEQPTVSGREPTPVVVSSYTEEAQSQEQSRADNQYIRDRLLECAGYLQRIAERPPAELGGSNL